MERVISFVMAQEDQMKIINGFIFHNLFKAFSVKSVRCISTAVDHLKVQFQQDLARTHHIHLMHLRNMLIQITIII